MKPIGLASGYKQTEHLIFKTDSFFKKNLLDLRHPLDRNHTHVADISVTKPYHSNEFQWASKVAHSPRKIVKGLMKPATTLPYIHQTENPVSLLTENNRKIVRKSSK